MSNRMRVALAVATMLAVVFLALQLTSTWGDAEPSDIGITAGVGAGLALLAGQLSAGAGWSRLLPDVADRIRLNSAFHISQLGKYLPIGVGQAAGQVVLVGDLDVPRRTASAAWLTQMLVVFASGVFLGAGLALAPGVSWWMRLSAVGLAAPIVLVRGDVAEVWLARLGRRFPRFAIDEHLPSGRSRWECFAVSLLYFALHGIAFAVLLGELTGDSLRLRWVCGYALATAVSIVTPLPAGLGARETLLLLFSGAPPAVTLQAALLLRLFQIVVELVLLVVGATLTAWRRHREPIGTI